MWTEFRRGLHRLRLRTTGARTGTDLAVRGDQTSPSTAGTSLEGAIRFCMNCDQPLTGRFCAHCGQKDDDLRRPIWTFTVELLDDFIALDNRLLNSIGPLLLQPGTLSRRYVDGCRADYVPPLRMLVVVVVAFFLTLELTDTALIQVAVTPKDEPVDRASAGQEPTDKDAGGTQATPLAPVPPSALTDEQRTAQDRLVQKVTDLADGIEDGDGGNAAIARVNSRLTGAPLPEFAVVNVRSGDGGGNGLGRDDVEVDLRFFQPVDETATGELIDETAVDDGIRVNTDGVDGNNDLENNIKGFVARVLHGINVAGQNPRLFNDVFNDWLPRALVLLIPIMALVLRLFYWGRAQYYFNHLIFSLHLHAFMFLILTSLVVIVPRYGGDIGAMAFFTIMPLYGFVSMKRFYRQGWFKTTFKFLTVSFIYSFLLMMTLLTIVVYGLSKA